MSHDRLSTLPLMLFMTPVQTLYTKHINNKSCFEPASRLNLIRNTNKSACKSNILLVLKLRCHAIDGMTVNVDSVSSCVLHVSSCPSQLQHVSENMMRKSLNYLLLASDGFHQVKANSEKHNTNVA